MKRLMMLLLLTGCGGATGLEQGDINAMLQADDASDSGVVTCNKQSDCYEIVPGHHEYCDNGVKVGAEPTYTCKPCSSSTTCP